jgi:hypothetical protein
MSKFERKIGHVPKHRKRLACVGRSVGSCWNLTS